MRTRLIAYDISDDKCRTKLAKRLAAWGFVRIQYSVFAGTHSPTQWAMCWKKIQHITTRYGNGTEKVYVIIISPEQFKKMKWIGEAPDILQILNEKTTMWV